MRRFDVMRSQTSWNPNVVVTTHALLVLCSTCVVRRRLIPLLHCVRPALTHRHALTVLCITCPCNYAPGSQAKPSWMNPKLRSPQDKRFLSPVPIANKRRSPSNPLLGLSSRAATRTRPPSHVPPRLAGALPHQGFDPLFVLRTPSPMCRCASVAALSGAVAALVLLRLDGMTRLPTRCQPNTLVPLRFCLCFCSMFHGSWFMVHGSWFMVHSARC